MAAATALRAAAVVGILAVVAATGAAPSAVAAENIRVTPQTLAPGIEVTVTATGFPPQAGVELGVGPPSSEYTVIDTGITDASGAIMFMLHLSDRAPVGTRVVFVVALEDFSIKATSTPLEIASPVSARLDGPGS